MPQAADFGAAALMKALLRLAAVLALLCAPLSQSCAQQTQAANTDQRLWLSSAPWLAAQQKADATRTLRLGVTVFASPNLNDPIIERTVEELRRKLPRTTVTVAQVWQDELAESIEAGRFDLVLSSASFYFAARPLGLKDLATVVHNATPYTQDGPRLYSAGELGSMWGHIYQGATNNSEACVFGRIAGRNVAAEKPWS